MDSMLKHIHENYVEIDLDRCNDLAWENYIKENKEE